MTQSSFYADGETYDEAVVESNDHPGSNYPTPAPSGFYPNGGVYDELTPEGAVLTTMEALRDQAQSSANAAAASDASAGTHDASSAAHDAASGTSAASAAASADAAATSETNTAASEGASASSATASANSAASSATSAAEAATSKTNAATSETNAASSAVVATAKADIAATQAGIATTKAAQTSTSETNAASSASAAATSAANASSAVQAAAGTSAPLMDGAVAVGTAAKWSREDHKHPTDTSRAAVTYVDAQDAALSTAIATKAPTNSPGLTGTPTAPTPSGTNTQQIANVEFVLANGGGGSSGGSSIGRAINGLIPSNNATTPNTKLDISPGSARDKNLSVDIVLASGVSKTINAWALGTNNGALDTGSVAVNTGYHVFLIYNPTSSATDILFSTSPTAPVLPLGFTKSRRIGAFTTSASGFINKGLWRADGSFELVNPISAAAARSLTYQSLMTWPVPLGIKVKLKTLVSLINTTAGNPAFYGIMRDPDIGVLDGSASLQWQASHLYKLAGVNSAQQVECWVNTSGEVYTWSYAGDANNQGYYYLLGWTDLRDEFS